MKIKLWGVRGSIPTPGPSTVKYGGNTTCLEILDDDGERIILDAGTGIRELGMQLAREMPIKAHLFITHTHWDHIQGLPFFIPLFVPGNDVSIYGMNNPISMEGIRDVLSTQMEYRYFPVREVELNANINYIGIKEGETITIGATTVTSMLMNHPVFTFGFKVESKGKSFFFTGDHEPYSNIYSPGEEDYEDYEKHVREKHQILVDFIRGVDFMVADSQYTEAEYPPKIGWGHSTFDHSIALTQEAEISRLVMTHHEPVRDDAAMDAIAEELQKQYADVGFPFEIAKEGDVFEI